MPSEPDDLDKQLVTYVGVLTEQAKNVVKDIGADDLPLDPQGRVLIDVSLAEENFDEPELSREQFKSLKEKYHLTETTTVSLDIDSDVNLKKKFKAKLSAALMVSEQKESECSQIVEAYLNMPRGSVIALQQEMSLHMAGIKRLLTEQLFKDDFQDKSAEVKDAFQEAQKKLNGEIFEVFAKALRSAYDDKKTPKINIAKLNTQLDNARKDMALNSVGFLAKALEEKTSVNITGEVFEERIQERIQEQSQQTKESQGLLSWFKSLWAKPKTLTPEKYLKGLLEKTTASPNDVLAIESQLGLARFYEGSDRTSHDRRLSSRETDESKPTFAYKRVITFGFDGETFHSREPRQLFIRMPSPVVKDKKISPEEKIQDVKAKFDEIKRHYHVGILPFPYDDRDIPRALIYNRYTAFEHTLDDLQGKNKQTESAGHILRGVHRYNKAEVEKQDAVYVFVQNISVNGKGSTLGYSGSPLKKETTLMAEIAMLHTLYDVLPEEAQNEFKKILENYNTFLKGYPAPPGDSLFFASEEGQNSIQLIQEIKNAVTNQSVEQQNLEEEADTDLINQTKQVLMRLMAKNAHWSHGGAKVIQALSSFVEQITAGGCKSANERAEGENKRVTMLEALLHGDNDNRPEQLVELNSILRSLESMNDKRLSEVLDIAVNNLGQESSVTLISLLDQLASAKLQAEGSVTLRWYNPKTWLKALASRFNANYSESRNMSTLQAKNASEMQSHKKDAAKRLYETFRRDAREKQKKKQQQESTKPDAQTSDSPNVKETPVDDAKSTSSTL